MDNKELTIDRKNNILSVLILSCDLYEDIWPYFFHFFNEFWPDCPYDIYLGSNTIRYEVENIKMLLSGKDQNWADSAKLIVEQIPGDYFLLLLEDFFLLKKIDTKIIQDSFEAFIRLNGGYLRLFPLPKPDRIIPNEMNIGLISKDSSYRVALQAAIWKKNVFVDLLQSGETAWQMEINGTKRSTTIVTNFYSTWKPIIFYKACITLGKWTPEGIKICLSDNLQINPSKRMILTKQEVKKINSGKRINKLINLVPRKIRKLVKIFLKM